MNSKRKGALAISQAITYFIEQGFTPLLPVVDCDKYDLVVDNDGLHKIQCKYTTVRKNTKSYEVNLRTFGGYRKKTYHTKYIKGDFDFLFIYCNNKEKYLIPVDKIIGLSTITVGGNKWNEYKI